MIRSTSLMLVLLCAVAGFAQEPGDPDYRWAGKDFVFCFITDDGQRPNLAWADTARVMDFRFTMAVNINNIRNDSDTMLSFPDLAELAADGFEIGQHSYSHCQVGLPPECSQPPRGSLLGYFLCEGLDPVAAMEALHVEIERDSIAVVDGLDAADVRIVAYPRHRHNKALIDTLIAEGYIAARTGGRTQYELNSYGEFDVRARNGWEEGISLYRVPLATTPEALFGDHSADPSVQFTYEEFLTAAQPHIDRLRDIGGILVIYAHHLGNDDDSFGDVNYDSGGMTKQDLAWLVDLVRANNGAVMPFGEAATFFRSRSTMENLDGDYVWIPDGISAVDLPNRPTIALNAYPNPFNSRVVIEASLPQAGPVQLDIYDASGALVSTIASEHREAGVHTWNWDGRDSAGRVLSAGMYFASLQSQSERVTRRLLFIK